MRKETMIMIGGALVLLGLFFNIVYKPAVNKIDELKSDVQKFQTMGFQDSAMTDTFLQKKKEQEHFIAHIAEMEKSFLDSGKKDAFMADLRKIIAEAEVFDDEVAPTKSRKSMGDLETIGFSMRMKGMFADIYSFLRSIEEMKEKVWLDKIILTRGRSKDGLLSLDLTLSVPVLTQ